MEDPTVPKIIGISSRNRVYIPVFLKWVESPANVGKRLLRPSDFHDRNFMTVSLGY